MFHAHVILFGYMFYENLNLRLFKKNSKTRLLFVEVVLVEVEVLTKIRLNLTLHFETLFLLSSTKAKAHTFYPFRLKTYFYTLYYLNEKIYTCSDVKDKKILST